MSLERSYPGTFKAHLDCEIAPLWRVTHRKEGITVAKTTDHPSKIFGTIGRAFYCLEEEGVGYESFLQRIIDDPAFRRTVAEAYKTPRLLELLRTPQMHGITQLLQAMFGSDLLPETRARYLMSSNYFHLLRRLVDVLNAEEESVIVQRFFVALGRPVPYLAVAEYHRVTIHVVRRLEASALKKMRARHEELQVMLDDVTPIEDLELSDGPRNCLKRAQIGTIGKLYDKTVEDLRAIRLMNERGVQEIIEKLRERGMTLIER